MLVFKLIYICFKYLFYDLVWVLIIKYTLIFMRKKRYLIVSNEFQTTPEVHLKTQFNIYYGAFLRK